MIDINSDALVEVARGLGVDGTGARVARLADGELDQVLDVVPFVRRGRTQAATQGIYVGTLRAIHAAANSVTVSLNPFNPGASAMAPYPASLNVPVNRRFDVWCLAAIIMQSAGAGALSAALTLVLPAITRGIGIDSAAASVTDGNTEFPLAYWDAFITENMTFGLRNGARGPWQPIGVRLPRHNNTILRLRSTSTAASTIECTTLLGVFPVALGQDVKV